jgi:Putative transposase
MTLAADEFMRRFLLHALPAGFHRIGHLGLIAKNARKKKIALARQLLNVVPAARTSEVTIANKALAEPTRQPFVCGHCGAQMLVMELFARAQAIRGLPALQGAP